jgi:hypothetical protein
MQATYTYRLASTDQGGITIGTNGAYSATTRDAKVGNQPVYLVKMSNQRCYSLPWYYFCLFQIFQTAGSSPTRIRIGAVLCL